MGTWTPRSLFFDNEPDHINALLREDVGELVQPDQYVCGHEAGVYQTRSAYTIGKDLPYPDLIRREAEQCDKVCDIIVNSTTFGGTGSGMTGNIFTRTLQNEFPKSAVLVYSVVPPPSMMGIDVVAT